MQVCVISDVSVHELPAGDMPAGVPAENGLIWIDMDHMDTRGMDILAQLFEVRPVDLEDCHVRTPVPKLHRYPDHHYTSINGLARGRDGRLYFQPLKVFQGPRLVVTVLGPTSSALPAEAARRELDAVRKRLQEESFRPRTSLDLITAIRREMMATIEQLIVAAAASISTFERRILEADPVKSERMLEDLFALRHDLQTIRTSAAQAHQAYSSLLDTAEDLDGLLSVDVPRVTELRQGFGNLVLTTDLEREYLQEMLDLFQTRVATELNRFVRRVTAWATIGIAWTVVAGVYGMNFVSMPGLDASWGFPAVIGATCLLSIVLAIFFRRHGWL
jgi:Mg2+ and Co2+ transporter CorA